MEGGGEKGRGGRRGGGGEDGGRGRERRRGGVDVQTEEEKGETGWQCEAEGRVQHDTKAGVRRDGNEEGPQRVKLSQ